MNRRSSSWLAAVSSACLMLHVQMAHAQSGREIQVPVKRSLALPATGEALDLDAMVSVFASTTQSNDGTTVNYSCETTGQGGSASQASYVAAGLTVDTLLGGAPLPADVGIACAMTLSSPQATQAYQLRVQASIGIDGLITSAVVLDVVPVP